MRVAYLIGALSRDIAPLTARQLEETQDSAPFKEMLLKKFKFSVETLRQLFRRLNDLLLHLNLEDSGVPIPPQHYILIKIYHRKRDRSRMTLPRKDAVKAREGNFP
ncbi:hypothetical protein TNIN_235061 [Trichonephila inaurata madagascariensis]|uniref:Uncharacterized protein n=1 Tax=Trichonephila inaurata madagascariensis TaxID=2747483 RepID=A0A8X6IC12_9ARAC|nr:hypothetical protein TNIN_235061 [Trichonephila inaurata madagascariensis]